MKKNVFALLTLVCVSFLSTACRSNVPMKSAEALAQTNEGGGTILWKLETHNFEGLIIFLVCSPEGNVETVTVRGPAEKPVVQSSFEPLAASCGERHEFWTSYDAAIGSGEPSIQDAVTGIQNHLSKYRHK